MFRWNVFHVNMLVNELFTSHVTFKHVSYLVLVYAVLLYLHKFLKRHCCRMELDITVAVAFILCGFSLNFQALRRRRAMHRLTRRRNLRFLRFKTFRLRQAQQFIALVGLSLCYFTTRSPSSHYLGKTA